MKKYVAFDVEATGLDPYRGKAQVFSFALCDDVGNTSVHRLDCPKKGKQNKKMLEDFLNDSSIVKICHNYHFELSILQENGYRIHPETQWEDTMFMSQLFDNIAAGHGLDEAAIRFCDDPRTIEEWMETDNAIDRARKIYQTYDKIPEPLMTRYQHADVERTMLLFQTLKTHIHGDKSVYPDYLNELNLVIPTIAFERRGVMICRAEAEKLLQWLNDELRKVEKESFDVLGQYINLNSGPQVVSILYDNLKLPVLARTRTGQPSTDKDMLEELRPYAAKRGEHILSIFDLILRQRSYTKGVAMVTSYIDAAGEDQIIHPHINTNRAQTGRESGENPNMQNISKEAALKTRFPVPARKCFRARPGHILFLFDYSGIEMRLIAELTEEPELMQLVQDNGDPHTLAAGLFYGSIFTDDDQALAFVQSSDRNFSGDCSKAKKVMRTAAKNSQFALCYGAQLPTVAETLMLSKAQAAPGYKAYCDRFPKVAGFTNRMKHEIQNTGYVVTPFGRRLRTNPGKPYSASNYIIQGTAAGILKRAQVHVHRYLQQEWAGEIALVIPIHDELIIECPRRYLPQVNKLLDGIRKHMITMPEIKVPLDVEIKMTTYTWSEAKEYHYEKAKQS